MYFADEDVPTSSGYRVDGRARQSGLLLTKGTLRSHLRTAGRPDGRRASETEEAEQCLSTALWAVGVHSSPPLVSQPNPIFAICVVCIKGPLDLSFGQI